MLETGNSDCETLRLFLVTRNQKQKLGKRLETTNYILYGRLGTNCNYCRKEWVNPAFSGYVFFSAIIAIVGFFNHCAQRLVKWPTYKVTHVIISFFYICRNGFISLFRGKFPEFRFLMSHNRMSHVRVHNGRGYDACCNLMSGCYSGCIYGFSKSSKDL